jgi:cyclopropane-fatty-acyl-phospholipid synthase
VDRFLARRLLSQIGDPPLIVELWDGSEVRSGHRPAVARVRIHDRAALASLLLRPDSSFGELYTAGRLTLDGELVESLVAIYDSMIARSDTSSLTGRLFDLTYRVLRFHTLHRSRANVHHHYDLDNDFYAWWLDSEHMQYTCAYYPDPTLSLEAAQAAKMHHVCRKVRLQPGDTVIEAGCGWGGLARFMARNYGATVRAYNLSREQLKFARNEVAREGLADRVQFVEDDYRNISGRCDVFVSVGMLEHVGPEHYATLGGVIDRCLDRHGRGLIHTIGRNAPARLNPWIERRIFPGGYPPTLRQMMSVFEPSGFSVLDVENLRLHYARTLEHWLERFEQKTQAVERKFGEGFVRLWRLYLAGSVAAFTTGTLQLFQVVFARARDNDLPWSREHLYRGEL